MVINADQKFSEFLAISNPAPISASAIKVMFRASGKLCENHTNSFLPSNPLNIFEISQFNMEKFS